MAKCNDKSTRVLGRSIGDPRSFRANQVAHHVIRLLAKAEGIRGKLTPHEYDQNGFPWKLPSVAVQRVDALGEHDCFTVTETAAGVTVKAHTTSLLVTSLTELETSFPQLLEAIRSELSLLTADKLVPGQLYEVVAPIELNKTPIQPGTVLKFCKSDHNYHDGETTYKFETQSAKPDPEIWYLSNYAPITPSMSQWLRPFTGECEIRGATPSRAFLDACKLGDVEGARAALAEHVPSPMRRNEAFELACGAKSAGCVALLANLPVVDKTERGTFLRRAAEAGFALGVQALLDAGVPADEADNDGQTALIHAAWYGHLDVVRLLLARDANPSLAMTTGNTALTFARTRHHVSVVMCLERGLARRGD